MTTPAENLIEACKESWEDYVIYTQTGSISIENTNKQYCNLFLQSVAESLGMYMSRDEPDGMIEHIRENWRKVKTASTASLLASQGVLVVACLKSNEHNPRNANGHVAVIVPGPLHHGKYPRCWCGGMGAAQSQGNKSVGEVWNKTDRDQVSYYRAP